jgi:hypothetical protein
MVLKGQRKRLPKQRKKSSKEGSTPTCVNPRSAIKGPSKKKKKVQKKTLPPHPSPVRDVAESVNVVPREVHVVQIIILAKVHESFAI